MKTELQAKARWLFANFKNELVAAVWVALICIWFNVDRAIYIIKAPWGSAFLLFSVIVSMVILLWSLIQAWRKLTGEVKWWGRQIKHVQQTAAHSIQEANEHAANRSCKDPK